MWRLLKTSFLLMAFVCCLVQQLNGHANKEKGEGLQFKKNVFQVLFCFICVLVAVLTNSGSESLLSFWEFPENKWIYILESA